MFSSTPRGGGCRFLAFTLFLMLILPGYLSAQSPRPPFFGFHPVDSVFHIGVVNGGVVDTLRDMNVDFVRYYQGLDPDEIIRTLDDTNITEAKLAAGTTHDTVAVKRRTVLLNAITSSLKIYAPVNDLAIYPNHARALEHYAKEDQLSFHNLGFLYPIPYDNTEPAQYGLDSGVIFYTGGSPGNALIAAYPRYDASNVFFRSPSSLYDKMGLPDHSAYIRFSVAMRADSIPVSPIIMPDSTKLAYLVLYRRVRSFQDTCKCPIYEPFTDTLWITKKSYRDSSVVADNVSDHSNGYQEIGWTIDMVRDTLTKLRDSVITYSIGGHDTTEVHRLYRIDTIPSHIIDSVITDTTVGGRHIVVHYDILRHYHVPLQEVETTAFLYGDGSAGFGDPTYGPGHVARCSALFRSGAFGPNAVYDSVIAPAVSDLDVRFGTTRRVPISFLRLRVNQDTYDRLRDLRYDSTVLGPKIDSFYTPKYARLRSILGRIAYSDEAAFQKVRADGADSRSLQYHMYDTTHNDTLRQLWQNPQSDYDGLRVMSEDLDSTKVKTIQIMIRQDYLQYGGISDPIPIKYPNPDLMSWWGFHHIYTSDTTIAGRDSGETHFRMIFGNSAPDYELYTKNRQVGWGSLKESKTDKGTLQGHLITTLARAVDAARFKYSRFGPACPVWNMIQDYGEKLRRSDGSVDPLPAGAYGVWSYHIPTPEEITAQVWLSLNCGATGVVYTDAEYSRDGHYGFLDQITAAHHQEYDAVIPVGYSDSTSRVPKIWLGNKSRYDAIKRVNNELRRLDTLIHLPDLVFNQEQMSMIDQPQSFSGMPLLDTVRLERSIQHSGQIDSGNGGYAPLSPRVFDSYDSSYVEISHFLPGPHSASDVAASAHYILFTNRRCWPVDGTHYSQAYFGGDTLGLGAIDVRRPVIKLKAPPGFLADSMIVEKVLDTTWRRTVAIGGEVALDWIEPGWGVMYRFKPIAISVSAYGTAYNNAVHGENPSTVDTARDRYVVYERDSSVYMRVMDRFGATSQEYMVSDAADTVHKPGWGSSVRKAGNFFPTVASCRNRDNVVIVWERDKIDTVHRTSPSGVDTIHLRSVEACYLPARPTRLTMPPTGTTRLHITMPRTMPRKSREMTPAVVGIDSGYVIAWADSNYMIGAMALRSPLQFMGADTSRTIYVNSKLVASVHRQTQYPTLAYYRTLDTFTYAIDRLTGGHLSDQGPPSTIPNDSSIHPLQVVHLAYQQNDSSNQMGRIFYHKMGVRFPIDSVPQIAVADSERVSDSIRRACNYLHPSIAADSGHIGIAFEAVTDSGNIVILRFRDTKHNTLPNDQRWVTPYYSWGGSDPTRKPTRPYYRKYSRPSLTEFPSLPLKMFDSANFSGGLVWQWNNPPDGRSYREMLYRFGTLRPDTLSDGHDPSLMLVPQYTTDGAFAQSSAIHRNSNATGKPGRTILGATTTYYPLEMDNSPTMPVVAFTRLLGSGNITSFFQITQPSPPNYIACAAFPSISGGLKFTLTKGKAPTFPPPIGPPLGTPPYPCELGRYPLPPSFVPPGTSAQTIYNNILLAWQAARTGVFIADSCNPPLVRQMLGSDSLVSWLNTQPYDSTLGKPANIFARTELVRVSDSTVLWSGDTVSARGLGNTQRLDTISLNTSAYAGAGTKVFFRVQVQATTGVSCTVNTGFYFDEEEDDTTGTTLKMVRPETRVMPESPESALSVRVIPNPARDQAELRIRSTVAGTVRITISDVLGRVVRTLPSATLQRAGEYGMPLDVNGLLNGSYTVQVDNGESRGSTQMVIMK